jgi:hypothetical protein
MQRLGVNPWITMWYNPKRTIRAIVEAYPRMGMYYLGALIVLQNLFFVISAYSIKLGAYFNSFIGLFIIISPLVGVIWINIFAIVLFYIGRFLGGNASFSYVRACFSWSSVPYIIDVFMWLMLFAFAPSYFAEHLLTGVSFFFVHLIYTITGVWSFVLLVLALMEVQQFTAKRAILNIVVTNIIIGLLIIIPLFIYYYLIK